MQALAWHGIFLNAGRDVHVSSCSLGIWALEQTERINQHRRKGLLA
jgi:hypothetical protein